LIGAEVGSWVFEGPGPDSVRPAIEQYFAEINRAAVEIERDDNLT